LPLSMTIARHALRVASQGNRGQLNGRKSQD
jgi:hypothetical protein